MHTKPEPENNLQLQLSNKCHKVKKNIIPCGLEVYTSRVQGESSNGLMCQNLSIYKIRNVATSYILDTGIRDFTFGWLSYDR